MSEVDVNDVCPGCSICDERIESECSDGPLDAIDALTDD